MNLKAKRLLDKALESMLPSSNEYVLSSRYEGALTGSEEKAPHKKGAIFIDSELSQDQYGMLRDQLYDYLSKNNNFKRTKYQTVLWKNAEFTVIAEHRATSVCSLNLAKTNLDRVEADGSASGDWDNFSNLCKGAYKKEGQLFLLTTKAKIETLESAGVFSYKNMIIIYPGDDENNEMRKIKGIPCIPVTE